MYNDHHVLIDMRWRELGWLEAFRLRLAGWLPANEAERGFNHGVIERFGSDAGRQVVLTVRGGDLTEPAEASMSDESCRWLASILHIHEFSPAWMDEDPKVQAVILDNNSHFNGPFRDKMVAALQVEATKPADY